MGLAVWLIGSAVSVAIACVLARPAYEAAATIEVKPVVTARAQGGAGAVSLSAFFDTQMAKVSSDSVLSRALDSAPEGLFVQSPAGEGRLTALRDALEVERLASSHLFAVRLRGETPQGLATVVNEIADACVTEAREDERRATAQQRQRLEAERERLDAEVRAKTAALARVRAAVASSAGGSGGASKPDSAVEQALVDVRAKRASLRARLDERRAALTARQTKGFTAQVDEALARDVELGRLSASRSALAPEVQKAQIEAASPAVDDLEALVSHDPRVVALREEATRRHRLLNKLLDAAAHAKEAGQLRDSTTIPCALIIAALPDHPKVQRLAGLHEELTRALKLELGSDKRTKQDTALRGSSTHKVDSLRSHLLTVQLQLQQYRAAALEAAHAAARSLPERLADEQERARERIVARRRKSAKDRLAALQGQVRTVDGQITERRERIRPQVAMRLETVALEPIRTEIRELGTELVACEASKRVLEELLGRQGRDRAAAEVNAVEVRALEDGLAHARQALSGVEQDRVALDTMVAVPGVVTVASRATAPVRPKPFVGQRVGYAAAGIAAAFIVALTVSRLLVARASP
ncbi:hypothetical protein ACFL09_04480 [Planctomycetota bacterium]